MINIAVSILFGTFAFTWLLFFVSNKISEYRLNKAFNKLYSEMITIGDEGTKRFVNAKDVDFGEDFEYDEWEMMKEAVSAIPEYDKTVKPESDEFLKENFENTGVYSIVNINKVNKS